VELKSRTLGKIVTIEMVGRRFKFGRVKRNNSILTPDPHARVAALLLIALMAHSVGCARRFPATEVTPIKAANLAELQRYLLSRKPDVAQFRMRGPFDVIERRDLKIPLVSGLTVEAD
jgi:hypothetical protein